MKRFFMKVSVRPFSVLFVLCVISSTVSSCTLKAPSTTEGGSPIISAAKDDSYTKKFSCQGYSCELLVPAHYSFAETDQPIGKLFVLTGQKHANGKSPILNLKIVKNPPGEPIPPIQPMVDSVLQPYGEQLSHYAQTVEKPFAVNGHSFLGSRFTGEFPGTIPASGFVFASEVADTFFIFSAEDTKPDSETSIPDMLKSVGTLKIGSDAK